MMTKEPLNPVLADARYLVKTAFAAQTVGTGNTITASDAWTHSGAVSFTAAGTAVSVTNNATVGGTLGVTGLSTLTGGFASVAASTVNGGAAIALAAWRTNAGTVFRTYATDGATVKFSISDLGAAVVAAASATNIASVQITGTGGTATTVMLASNGSAFLRGSSTNGFFEITSDFGAANQTGKIAFGSSSVANAGFGWNTVLANMIITSKNDRLSFINDSDGLEAWRLTTNTGVSITSLTQTSLVAAGANTGFTFNASNAPSFTAAFQSNGSIRFLIDESNKGCWINAGSVTGNPGLFIARNSTTVDEQTMGVAGAANVYFTGTAQGDGIVRMTTTTQAMFIGVGSTTGFIKLSGNTTVSMTWGNGGPVLTKAATSAALSVRNATATLADLNLNVLGADPATLQNGDFWITDIGGVRKLNARIVGVSYSVQIS